ncbi:hypothetical protein OUZ56_000253 [Daphnia magna]|uniref:Uncharacterized protein n=1 Tax=Daphnia magna TaxID=35525 RepID=A0ABQ9ZZ38_9CRUS|nr:hypothetical protein OUZ56_000253 [Daphnia magna]
MEDDIEQHINGSFKLPVTYPSRFPPLEVLQTPRKDAHPRIVLRSPTFLSAANKDKCCFQCGYETANKISRPCTEG